MKTLLSTLLFFLWSVASTQAQRPNVVIIMADDMGWSDIGSYGSEVSGPTPGVIVLVNQVRTRAGLPNLPAADIASATTLRDAILRERGWEFISEGRGRKRPSFGTASSSHWQKSGA